MRNDIRSVARRAGLGAVLTLAVSALIVGIPVVTGANTPVTLDSSSSLATHGDGRGGSPVVLGVDGIPGLGVPGAPPAPAAAPAPAPEVVVPAPVPAPSAEPEPEPEPVETEPSSAPVAAAITAAGPEAEVLALVNQERAAAGCGALAADGALAAVARNHSADMRDRDFFDHTNPDGLDPLERAAAARLDARAENIAAGQPDAAAVMDDWMNSAGHRANILDCSLTRLGVGMAEGSGGPWWTQLFG
ncbi:MAG TPA: CAP domain-containing protein [Blastococcus sp.]|nr:CAP domain-containing protein [Blastococcus sp.]